VNFRAGSLVLDVQHDCDGRFHPRRGPEQAHDSIGIGLSEESRIVPCWATAFILVAADAARQFPERFSSMPADTSHPRGDR
jgi:hypothetical protein